MSDVVVLGGGQWQLPIVSFLQGKGHEVIVVHPFATDTTAVADDVIYEDVRDIQRVRDRLYDYNPIFVTSDQSDISVLPVSLLSAMIGTCGNSPSSVMLFTHKLAMARFCDENGFLCPSYRSVRSVNDVFDPPVVLKPVDSNASRGFIKVDNLHEDDLHACKSHSYVGSVMCQEYIQGEMYILDGFCSNYKHITLTCGKKMHFRDGIASSVSYPADVPQEAISNNNQYVEKSGLRFGITHAEYIVKDGKFYLLEIAARGGGFAIGSSIVPWVSGFNTYEALYDNLTGKVSDLNFIPLQRPARLQFFEYPVGRVVSISGVEEVKKLPGVQDFRMAIKVGDYIKPATDGSNRHASAFITDDNTLNDIQRIIKVETENY